MKALRRATAIATVAICALIPVGAASASNSQAGTHGNGQSQAETHGKSGEQHGKAGEHGNHCGRGHAKKVKGEKGGLKIGQKCVKAPKGEDADEVEADDPDDSVEVDD